MNNILNDLTDFIENNKAPGVYIKFSLGRCTAEYGFDTRLFNLDIYNKIKNMLESYNGWEDKEEEVYEYTDEYPSKILNTMIISYVNGPYDILITAETQDKQDIDNPDNKETNIHSYRRKHHMFVLKNYDFIVEESVQKFELYITDSSISSKYLADSSMLKIKDITHICYKPDCDVFKILQKNN